MKLEEIIVATNDSVMTLDKAGKIKHSFPYPGYIHQIFARKNLIYVNSGNELKCYDKKGNLLWQTDISKPGPFSNSSDIVATDIGFFTSAIEFRNDFDREKEVLASTDTDVYASRIDFSGSVVWRKLLQERTANFPYPLANKKQLVFPLTSGVYVIDFNGKFQYFMSNQKSSSLFPIALTDDYLVIQETKDNEIDNLLIVDPKTQKTQASIPFNLSHFDSSLYDSQNSCSSIGNRLYFRNPNQVSEIDLKKMKMKTHLIKNIGILTVEDLLYVENLPDETVTDNLPEVIGVGAVSCYNKDMEKRCSRMDKR